MMPQSINKIKETCIYVADLAISKEFYHGKLNLEVIGFAENRHIFFRVGGSVLLCFIAESTAKIENLPPHFGSGQIHFAFEVAHSAYAEWKDYIEAKGITIEQEVSWGERAKSFYFRDPDLNLLEIVTPGLWEKDHA